MEKFLADTSAWIASFAKTGHEPLKQLIREKIQGDQLCIAGIIQFELLQGVKNSEQFTALRKKLEVLPWIALPDSAWSDIAKLSLELRLKGIQASTPDLIIAYLAKQNQLTLIHCDRDYDRIAKYLELKVIGMF